MPIIRGVTRAAGFVLMIIVLALSGYTFYEKHFQLHRGGSLHLVLSIPDLGAH